MDNREKNIIYDSIIVGGGPAGLTAGIYCARSRMKVLLIESMKIMSQATMTDNIENYPGIKAINGFDLVDNFKKQAVSFGLETYFDTVKNIQKTDDVLWTVYCNSKSFKTKTIIIATGASSKKLNVPGENEFLGKGVSYCATCDGAFFKEKNIIVIGGGDTAVEEALFLTKFGKKVTLIHRRNELRATKILQERLLSNEKIDIIWDSVITNINGKNKVEKVIGKNVKTNIEFSVFCDGVFIFVGWIPNTIFLENLLKKDDKGFIVVDKDMKTSEKGIFACGDCCSKKLKQVITASSDGAIAGYCAMEYIG